MAQIVFTVGTQAGLRVELRDKPISMGRSRACDLMLDDLEVSSSHARLEMRDGAWHVIDLRSSNGTIVNGRAVENVKLSGGDVVEVGNSAFIFTADGPATERPAPAAEAKAPTPAPPPAMPEDELKLAQQMSGKTRTIRDEVGKVIIGQRDVIDQILMCMLADGHALLVGLPGMAKTLIVRTIAGVLDMKFKRIQFTPDLMPTDITGTDILEMNRETGQKEFRFIKGPIFCNILLGDEINRTPPKTQAALLEAMQERRVTAGNTTYELDRPFLVLATQNPIEQEGTYPLPEAQLDRFMFNIWVAYPSEEEEELIVDATTASGLGEPQCILKKEEVLQLQKVVRKIPVSKHVIKYAIRLVRATRPEYDTSPEVTKKYVSTGAGPRAGQYLILGAKARAVLDGRIHVSCGDIRKAAIPVLRHRIITNFAADSEGLKSMDIVTKLLDQIQEPGDETYTPIIRA